MYSIYMALWLFQLCITTHVVVYLIVNNFTSLMCSKMEIIVQNV